MSSYPTPPSSSGDSPQHVYFVASPNSNSFALPAISSPDMNQHQYIQAQIISDSNMMHISSSEGPYLRFIEEPTNKFRFRYKSEMAGTHGSLCGITSDKSRKQTYPTVELVNCSEKAKVRCSIYQYNVKEDFKPHPHRLIMKKGREECDDPHDIDVGPEEGYVATFHSMGIIHTARKNIVSELIRKKTILKKELIAAKEGQVRELTFREQNEIKGLAEHESKSINLNIVCLRFDAFIVKNGIRNSICPPIFSHGINNLKCALTGDLKIVRMDHCTSPAKGSKEIFLLVERVTKKNIRIRFFELDDDEQEVWEGWGKFTELDVHHQYAIVFRTPAFRDQNIISPVKVYMELVRPSDNARSEVKDFRYIPNGDFKPGAKRMRSNYDSSSSYNSTSFSSSELPATIASVNQPATPGYQLPSANSWSQNELLPDDQLMIAYNDIDSDEFKSLFNMVEHELPDVNHAVDSPLTNRLKEVHLTTHNLRNTRPSNTLDRNQHETSNDSVIIKMEVSPTDLAKAERTNSELRSFIKTTDAHQRASAMLDYHLGNDYANRRNNALHIFIGLNRKEEVTFILKMLVLSKRYDLTNVRNADNLTPLYIAVMCRNEEFAKYLLCCQADPTLPDNKGRTALHAAIQSKATPTMLDLLLSNRYSKQLVDLEDYDGTTPLNFALEKQNMTAVKILCKYGANINRKHPKNGFTPLRIAIENRYAEGVKFILEHPEFDRHTQNDFRNISPLDVSITPESSSEIRGIIEKYTVSHDMPMECKTEIEDEDEEEPEEMEEDIDVKPDISVPVENPESLYVNLTNMNAECLEAVSAILDESGNYLHLAELLDLSHLIHTGIISSERSPSKNLLQYAIEKDNVKLLDIRTFLDNLDEHKAVSIMDRMAYEAHAIVRT